MNIIIIVNIIVSLGIILGGICMKKYAASPADKSIGYKTTRAVCNEKTWYYANNNCGKIWIITGIISFLLTLAALIFITGQKTAAVVQTSVLILMTVSVIISAAVIESKLKRMINDSDRS